MKNRGIIFGCLEEAKEEAMQAAQDWVKAEVEVEDNISSMFPQ